jgi:hypothetical protein
MVLEPGYCHGDDGDDYDDYDDDDDDDDVLSDPTNFQKLRPQALRP